MTAWHTEEEWKKFKEQGQVLRDQRICVLCHRTYITTVICTIRAQEGSSSNPIVVKPNTLLQQYRVMSNCVGGYYIQDVTTAPSQLGWEGVVGAMVIHRKHRLVHKTKTDGTKQRWLDQSAIMYQPPKASNQPDLGELNQDFQDRSGLLPPGLEQLDAQLQDAQKEAKKIDDEEAELEDSGDIAAIKEKTPMLRKRRRMNKHKQEELRNQRIDWLHDHSVRGPRLDLIMANHCATQCGPLLLLSADGALPVQLQQNPVMSLTTWLHTLRLNPLYVRDHAKEMIQELQQQQQPGAAFGYEKGLLMDACLEIWCGRRKQVLYERDLVCGETLDDLFNLFFSFAFGDMTKTPKETPRIRHLLMKAWPVRCWTRKFDSVANKYNSKDPQCDNQLHRILLCCLLGNYSWIDNDDSNCHRPNDPRVRYQLHRMFDAGKDQTMYRSLEWIDFRKTLAKKSPQIHLHALQLYICSLVRSNSVVRAHAQREFDYAEFEKQVVRVTNNIRKAVNSHFVQAFAIEPEEKRKPLDINEICQDVNKVTEDVKKSILDKSYERRPLDFLQYICSIQDQRGKYNPRETPLDTWTKLMQRNHPNDEKMNKPIVVFREPVYIKPSTALGKHADAMMKKKPKKKKKKKNENDMDDDDGDDDEEPKERKTLELTNPNGEAKSGKALGEGLAKDPGFVEQELALLKSGGVAPIPDDKSDEHIVVTKMDITVAHSKALEELLKRFDPNTCTSNDVFNALQPHLVSAFGCSAKAHERLLEFQKQYRDYQHTKQYWEEQVRKFWTDFPYTYCLIRALGQLYVRYTKIKIHSLPPAIAYAQIAAIQSRTQEFIKHSSQVCIEEPLYLRMCFCCRYINTVFIPERMCSQRQASHVSPSKACKRVMVDVDDHSEDEEEEEQQHGCGIYCHNVYVYAHHRCDQRPLMEIGMLGKCIVMVEGYRLQERKRLFMFCCQKGCGQAMQVDQLHTLWNEQGIACTACTSRSKHQAYEDCRNSYAFLSKTEEFKCFTCDKSLSEKRGFSHWDGVKICIRCHRSKLPLDQLYDYVKVNLTVDVWAVAKLGRGLADEELKKLILKFKQIVAADRAPGDKKKNDLLLKRLKSARVARKGGHS
jgi:hypothetical protein